jgi:RNA polymerase sigma factor (sigma-70 family)
MTDQEIINGIRQNDKKITEHVYETLGPPIFKYVLTNSGTKDDAMDVFHDTFIKVLNKIEQDKYKDENKFEAYFIQIARFTWIDKIRDRKQGPIVGDSDTLLERADEGDEDAIMELILHDKRLEVLDIVWQSWDDTDCRRRLNAYHYEDESTQEIANTEGVERNTILKRLYDCRKKLFKLISKQLQNK